MATDISKDLNAFISGSSSPRRIVYAKVEGSVIIQNVCKPLPVCKAAQYPKRLISQNHRWKNLKSRTLAHFILSFFLYFLIFHEGNEHNTCVENFMYLY